VREEAREAIIAGKKRLARPDARKGREIKVFVVGAGSRGGELLSSSEELGVDGHHVFIVAVERTVLTIPHLAVALDDLRLNLATFSCIRSRQSFFPAMIASRASFTHAGQRESVCRGKPSVGLVFSHDFSSGLSDHFGRDRRIGIALMKYWMVLKVIPAVLQTTQSNVLAICVPT